MKPTDTAEFIGELNAGVFANQVGHALSEVAAGVVDNKKVGTVTLTFSLKQIADSHQVTVNHKLAYKVPTKRGSRTEDTTLDTPMYVGEGGRLTLFPETPAADQMFDRNAAPVPARS
ncbi:hypothetical protein [Pseudomonas syringae]|uniref:hypothetical protein n=1 Tax=Pseudomonas syringae TaxID=317 RepID=UPI0002EF74F3|nr:hypothetical protein [Pseudomonas syringae]AQL40066.1 hypothetical protein JN853_29060 [Pseudomonas syringae pv. actinidiae ICMP 9853]EPM83584.1 hypothetical protein A260_23930 [Pseudomonas syringae pv. actinidiae ICMP 19068]EPM93796.1 hypothetical protein A258_23213 [Pseudomonas syringae pv. actinidiae ICMP 19104]EPN08312.1 hypothetical protein A252_23060 [Pseudomonas syringae pv. actinidiae ICMP 9855]KCU95276.1 hypothetical protein A250_25241 [Pseudomonas syringae pv. actinidiae ICMP 9617